MTTRVAGSPKGDDRKRFSASTLEGGNQKIAEEGFSEDFYWEFFLKVNGRRGGVNLFYPDE